MLTAREKTCSETDCTAAASTYESNHGAESTAGSNKTYRLQSDYKLEVIAAGQAKPGDAAATVSGLEELTTATRDWRLPQFVTLWDKLPGVQPVKRFENHTVAIARVWRAIERLHKEPRPKGQGATKKKGRAGSNGSESD